MLGKISDINEIKIGWKWYKIRLYDEQLYSDMSRTQEVDSAYDVSEKEIAISTINGERVQNYSLLCEILKESSKMFQLELAERDITGISNALYTFLEDNNLKIVKK